MVAFEDFSKIRTVVARKLASGRRKGLYYRFWRYGLRRDLSKPVKPPSADLSLHIRPLTPDDIEPLFGHRHGDITPEETIEIRDRMRHIEADIPTCYVAVDETSGLPCFCQWLMGPDQNDAIQSKLWGLPVLKPHEALLEHTYVPPAYRGRKISSAATFLLSEKARELGNEHALILVPDSNLASLRSCRRAGFDIFMIHEQREYMFGIYKRRSFNLLRIGDPRLSRLDT